MRLAAEAVARSGSDLGEMLATLLGGADTPAAMRAITAAMGAHLKRSRWHNGCPIATTALEMAITQRRPEGVIHHSDHGSQPTFKRSSQHLERRVFLAEDDAEMRAMLRLALTREDCRVTEAASAPRHWRLSAIVRRLLRDGSGGPEEFWRG